MPALVKICGLSTAETVAAALDAGADMLGFVFFPRSPRHVAIETAAALAAPARGRAQVVALTVDATDEALDTIVAGLRPDILQLHGAETPARAGAIRARMGIAVMKAIRVGEAADLAPVPAFAAHVDRFLFDAKPPPGLVGALPGGNGLSFDWRLVRGLDPGRPWMLSGGLDPANVAEALDLTGAPAVDVSSGVESAPGVKDPDLIRAFVSAVRWRAPAAATA
ncbi:phosphoribosylanthranilate isomerase [Prosthecodimorpha staleyi]|uniref:N-(5'-phosphoribosyl)anthranilate isomerase n=1 Tax=Prosthecodimorpha staleyi TaxID=2840188 RepID=A0A947D898_9HYPH|nr:phosphoribosylanthranilate isomerase [Prosthecodimorpha staleyi]MBT9292816.1 phosphoribosylanthranilate isomerase [Prosthecodimorpha staleyi]